MLRIILLLLLLPACATGPRGEFVNSKITQAQADMDIANCNMEVSKAKRITNGFTDGYAQFVKEREIYSYCMQGKGWVYQAK